jgi:hypothetical protein
VPNAPGVPPLNRVANVQNNVGLLLADAAQIANLFAPPQWGLFTQNGGPLFPGFSATPIINAITSGVGIANTSVGEEAYRREYRISTAPQEQGAFLSYNKVQMPFDGRVSYIVSGLPEARAFFLQQLETAAATLDLYSLMMPEFSYPSVNIIHHDFRRSARRGLQMLEVDIWVEEVRITGTAQFSNGTTKKPSGANSFNAGGVSPTSPNAAFIPPGALT